MILRARLWHRWFLLSTALVLLALAAMLLVQERGFQRGLLAHANALERERLPLLGERLLAEYRQQGTWRGLAQHPRRWHALMRDEEAGPPAPRPPPLPRAGMPLPPPREGRPPPNPLGLVARLSLLDAQQALVFGRPPSERAYLHALLLEGEPVGYLSLEPMPELQQALDLQFAAEQRRHALWIALAVLLTAALASLTLSRLLLRRLGALADASRRLEAGELSVRVGDRGSDEIGELARDFDRLATSLQRGREARDRWIADISHELRTPLTVLRGELHALQDGIRPLDAEALASLQVEADRLSQRIDDLYALALSDSGGLAYRFGECDLVELVQRVLASHRGAFERAGLRLEARLPTQLRLQRADPARLEQLLCNLLGNSLRYTRAPGEVRLLLGPSKQGVGEMLIEDSAPGVAEADLRRLCERHFRTASGAQVEGGAGLGLAICRNIVEAHGGRMGLAHSSLGGLAVDIRLPVDGGSL